MSEPTLSGMKVLDNSNLDAIIADAMPEKAEELPNTSTTNANGSVSGQPKAEEPKAEEKPKVETKPEGEDPDDIEGPDGLTPRQKREFTAAMQKTIGKKHRQAKEAEEFAKDQYNQKLMAERRIAELESMIQQNQRGDVQNPTESTGLEPPKRENFESDEAYQDARVDYRTNLRLLEVEQQRQQEAQQAYQQQILAQAESRIANARTLVPDFDDVVSAADVPVPPTIANYMQESEMFAELGYHFAKHPDALQKLINLPPMRQLVEIGKIEAILKPFGADAPKAQDGQKPSQDGKQETVTPSTNGKPRKAPAPITPLNTASGTQVQKAESEMSYEEAREYWAQRNGRNITKRSRH